MTLKRVAVVTGAGSGIGVSVAEYFSNLGAHTIMVDKSESVDRVARQLKAAGGSVESHQFDVSDESAVREFIRQIDEKHQRLDILINNAGIHPKRKGLAIPFEELTLDDWQTVHTVNLASAFLLCRGAIPLMRRNKWGRIVNIGSRAGRTYSTAAGAHYATSKAGMAGLTKALAGEFGPDGITVNCVAPGRVRTPLANEGGEILHQRYADSIPVRRVGSTEEVAALVGYLASEESGYVTGIVVDINGGNYMG